MKEMLEHAIAYHKKGNLDQALAIYSKITEHNPRFAHAYYLMGVICHQMKRLPEALKYSNASLSIRRDNAFYYSLNATINHRLGNISAAMVSYERSLALNLNQIETLKQYGSLLFEAGYYGKLKEICLKAIEKQLEDVQIYALLIRSLLGSRQLNECRDYLNKAKKLFKNNPDIDLLNGYYYEAMGDMLRARYVYEEVLLANPDCLAVKRLLAKSYMSTSDNLRAKAIFDEILKHEDCLIEDRVNAGMADLRCGYIDTARRLALDIIEENPGLGEAYFLKGCAEEYEKSFDAAKASYLKAIRLGLNDLHTWKSLGNVYRMLADYPSARDAYREALKKDSRSVEVLLNMALCYQLEKRHQEANSYFKIAYTYDPESAYAASGIAMTYIDLDKGERGRYLSLAQTYISKALEIDPKNASFHKTYSVILMQLGRISDSVIAMNKARELAQSSFIPTQSYLFNLNYVLDYNPQEKFALHQKWAMAHEEPCSIDFNYHKHDVSFGKEPKIRIGFVSGDFRLHPVGYFFYPVLKQLNRDRFEVFCYSNLPLDKADLFTDEIKKNADHWRSIYGVNDDNVLARIRNDEIDILVDLAGHTGDNRLKVFAKRAAPVQVSWLGYPNTTGLTYMDYRISDDIIEPEGDADQLSSEEIIRLPNGFLTYEMIYEYPEVSPAPLIHNGGKITLGSFNNIKKFSVEMIAVWARILKRLPQARLLFKERSVSRSVSRGWLVSQFIVNGIDPDRIEFIGFSKSNKVHMQSYSKLDMALDPFPYNGTTTTVETLLMGVPVVTLKGDTHVSRVSASILSRAGLDELIADSVDGYIDKVCELAQDVDRLMSMRIQMREKLLAGPVGNPSLIAEDFSKAMISIFYRSKRAGQPGELQLKLA